MKRRNLGLAIALAAVLVVGIALLFIGYALSGVDIAAWLMSTYAVTIYIILLVDIVVAAAILIKERIMRL